MSQRSPLPPHGETDDLYAVYHAADSHAMLEPSADRWFENGRNYTKVALVRAPLDQVFRLTTHGAGRPWTENQEIVWYDRVLPRMRDTQVGDVFLSKDDAWLLLPVGLQRIALPSPSSRAMYRGHSFVVSEVAWSPDGTRIVSGDWDGGVRVWEVGTTNDVVPPYSHRQGPVQHTAWSPDGALIASGNVNGVVRTFHLGSGAELFYEGHPLPLYDLRWERGGLLFCVGGEPAGKKVQLINATAQSRVFEISVRTGRIQAAAVSASGRLIAYAYEDGIFNAAIDVLSTHAPGLRRITYKDHVLRVRLIDFSPDGRTVASTGDDGLVRLWDASTGKRLKLCVLSTYSLIEREHNRAYALAWSPDGRYLAAGNADASVQIFDVSTGLLSSVYREHTSSVFALAWSPDGNLLASGGGDNTVQVWRPML